MGKLLAITKTLPKTADMTFQSLENGGAKLTCERASFKLMAPEFEAFPEIQEPKEGAIEIPTDIFSNAILHHTVISSHAASVERVRILTLTAAGCILEAGRHKRHRV